VQMAVGDTLCPDIIPNGGLTTGCDRHPDNTCNYTCSSNFRPTLPDIVCTAGGHWHHDVNKLCEGDLLYMNTLCNQNILLVV
jgi:hypothetical protein